jgi:hypothetical protein
MQAATEAAQIYDGVQQFKRETRAQIADLKSGKNIDIDDSKDKKPEQHDDAPVEDGSHTDVSDDLAN